MVGQTASATLTLTNNYGGSTSASHSLSGANLVDFTVSPATLSLSSSQSATLTITCTPSAAGTRTATLTVTATSATYGFSESYTYTLTCTGTNPSSQPGYGSNPTPGSTINAGNALVGQSTSTVLTVSETGNAQLDVTGHALSGTNAADFAVAPASFSIADGGPSQNLTITCAPAAAGTRTATLTVYHNASSPVITRGIIIGGSASYSLTCVGTTAPGYGSNPAPGSTIDVGSAIIGQSGSVALTVSETGNETLTVTGNAVSGANAADFTATPASFSIADGGASKDLTITCTPSAAGTRTATLIVYHNAPASPAATRGTIGSSASYNLTCIGTTVATPGYGSNPAPGSMITVGSAIIGQTSSTALAISEIGSATLNVTSHAISGANAADFAVTPASFSILNGGASKDLTITCAPSVAGTRTATLTVNHNASGSPATYTLTCVGTTVATAGYDSTPAPGSTVSMANAVVGGSASTTLVIREIGNATLQISGHSLSGTNAGDFSVTPATLTIPDGGSAQSLVIRCTPSTVGMRTATLTINHNASSNPATYTLACSATAMQRHAYVPMAMNP